jgi:hypothetical protein
MTMLFIHEMTEETVFAVVKKESMGYMWTKAKVYEFTKRDHMGNPRDTSNKTFKM